MKHVMKHDNMTSKLQANKRNFVCLLVSNLLVCGRDLDQVLAMDIEFLYAYHERELLYYVSSKYTYTSISRIIL